MPRVLPKLLAALPDSITAVAFLTAWIAPVTAGAEGVARLTEVMLMEFIVVHSSAFYAGIAAVPGVTRGKRAALLAGLSGLYLLFVLGFALADHSTWPIFAFAWLFVSRFMHIWTQPVQSDAETGRMLKLWAVSVAAYLFGALLTSLVPMPALGVTREFVASMHLSGSGAWIDRPQTVLAFGLLYFAIQAWVKYMIGDGQAASSPAQPDMLGRRTAAIARGVAGGRSES